MAWRKLAGISPRYASGLLFFFFFNCIENSGNELVDQHRYIFEFFLLYLWILGMLSNIILVADCWSLSQLDTS